MLMKLLMIKVCRCFTIKITSSVNYACIHCVSPSCTEFSLTVVKDSLRRLKWQKDRIAVHVDTTSSATSNQTIQRKMCDAIVEFVSVINMDDMLLVYLLNALHCNKIRAQVSAQCTI